MKKLLLLVVVVLVTLVSCGVIALGGAASRPRAAACLPGGSGDGLTVQVDTSTPNLLPGVGWLSREPSQRAEQVSNAAAVINAGQAMGLDSWTITVGVMTAMGESSLINVDFGDAVGPDSRGLFQQRANGSWGTYSDRTTPSIAATNFFAALVQVQGYRQMEPTMAAHRTQRNADPRHYVRYWEPAVEIVGALSGQDVSALAQTTGDRPCAAGPAVQAGADSISPGGWLQPAAGPYLSAYGMRVNPVTGQYKLHGGIDLSPPCGAPIWAAAGGTVVRAGPAASYGNLIVIDHGNGATTYYAHMFTSGVLVRAGQQVGAGDQVGEVGTAGNSTGCHLHFEVRVDGERTDPVPFLTARGVNLPPLT